MGIILHSFFFSLHKTCHLYLQIMSFTAYTEEAALDLRKLWLMLSVIWTSVNILETSSWHLIKHTNSLKELIWSFQIRSLTAPGHLFVFTSKYLGKVVSKILPPLLLISPSLLLFVLASDVILFSDFHKQFVTFHWDSM